MRVSNFLFHTALSFLLGCLAAGPCTSCAKADELSTKTADKSTDADSPDAESTDAEVLDAEVSDAEKPDANGSDAVELDAKELDAEDTDAEENDPLAVPDGTVDELFVFINKTMRGMRGRAVDEIPTAARAIIDAATKIRTIDGVTEEEEVQAISQMMPAMRFLADSRPDARKEMQTLLESLASDERPKIRVIGTGLLLQEDIRSLSRKSAEEREEVIAKVNKVMKESGATQQTYLLGSQLANALQQIAPESAIEVYENLAKELEKSEEERVQVLAGRARGAARQLQLIDNPIELSGPTDRGEPLDWDSYRGKVVLVDFWASWCGPCRGEIPNMKRNLEAYEGEFDIVGINMDQTEEAMQKYMNSEDIGWVNIVGTAENGVGWDHPIAKYYGVSGIPKAILVDREGNVVSLSARGENLDKLLAEMIGPLPEEAEESDEATSESAE